jgi:very-short-patch-repair endonuclease
VRNKVISYDPKLKLYARQLRKQSTLGEILLWKQIRNRALGVQFHRQRPMDRYIVDFYCHEIMLAIEIDGSSHDEALHKDAIRQQRLESLGVVFVRFHDLEIKNDMPNVLRALEMKVEDLLALRERGE